ncbi:MAG: hypothetical protein KDB07_08235, partial [Planctomycetes bacterium]|nr:hypothetical protein [Planctomycetota bacterium]
LTGEYDLKKAGTQAVLKEVLEYGLGLDSQKTLLLKEENMSQCIGVCALALELGVVTLPAQYLEETLATLEGKSAGVDAELLRRVKEYVAWSLLARAQQARSEGDSSSASYYLNKLKSDFPSSRAARS